MPLRRDTSAPVPLGPAGNTIIFLDFDGVLNSRSRWAKCWTGEDSSSTKLDPLAVARVTRLVTALNAKVVVSSAWRLLYDLSSLQGMLEQFGFPPGTIVDRTLNLPTGNPDSERGEEIKEWLDRHPQVTAFVILDDSDDMSPVRRHLVKTTWERGLEDNHVEYALRRFARGDFARRV